MYLLYVALWWCHSDLGQALNASISMQLVAERVRWSVGKMRTATWRIKRETVIELVGKVCELTWVSLPVILEADHGAQRRQFTGCAAI